MGSREAAAFDVMSREVGMREFVPYAHHITPTIVSTHNGEYLTIWKLTGRSHECADIRDVFRWTRDMNQFVRGVGSANIAFWTHLHRRRVVEYPEANFDNYFCRKLDEKYQQSFNGYNLMVNDLYLTVVHREANDDVMRYFAKRDKLTREEKELRQRDAVKALNDINRQLETVLKRRYGGELLSTYTHNGHAYSEVLEFLGFLVNGEKNRMPVARDYISDYLTINRPVFATWGEVGEQRLVDRTRHFGMLEIRDFDANTEPGQLNVLLETDYEYLLTQSFSCLSLHAAKGFLQRHKQLLLDAEDVATSQIEEIDRALDELVSRKFIMGEHHSTLLVYADKANELPGNMAKAKAALLDCGVVPSPVDLALEAGYWAQLPGNWKYRPRPMPITSLNFLSFSPFHNFLSGKPTGNPWGPAVTILKTASGTPLYLNFHVSGLDEDAYEKRLLGHTLIAGQSSAGKTTLLAFLLSLAIPRFGMTGVCFDKDRGMEIAILAMGGKYLPLRNGERSGFNPLQLEPTKANRMFIKSLVMKLVASSGEPVSHADEREIDHAIDTVMTRIDKPLRRLSMLLQSLPNPISGDPNQRPTVHARLEKWCEGGELGWLFDNEVDELDLSTHRLYGFDVTDFLDNPITRTPTIMYLLYRTEGMIDGRRFAYVFDEFWKILDDDEFEDFVKNKLKTIRKENGICIFSTQEPGDALESKIAKTIIQQLATLILLENGRGDRSDYVDGFKVTEAEWEAFKAIPNLSRRFLIKQGEQSAIASLNLGPFRVSEDSDEVIDFSDELLVLSGTPDNADIAEKVIAEYGSDPAVWIPVFLKAAREAHAVLPTGDKKQ
ncbi:Type IV secretion system protein virB4 [Burkholderia latens]|uniref:VirB4 family type IV secretion/conjugal transfer ATPase n=1 Tax=Burkholderia latens TaxID=488446 RepID=UPI0039A52D61